MGRIGVHVSAAGGPTEAVRRATAMGAECLQIFVGSPQTWKAPEIADDEVFAFREALTANGLGPLFVHAPYLINLASDRPEVRAASRRVLGEQLAWADRLGALGVVVHVGSGTEDALERVADGLREVLGRHRGGSALILENDAGSGKRVGGTFAELGQLIDAVGRDERTLVCFDTAHGLAAGYEIRTAEGLAAMISEIVSSVGLERLALLHVNDSKVDLGKRVDRHENLGQGKIGVEAFVRILAAPAFVPLPFILEVPGYDGKGPGRANVEMLRLLAAGRLADLPLWEAEFLATVPRPSSPSDTASSS